MIEKQAQEQKAKATTTAVMKATSPSAVALPFSQSSAFAAPVASPPATPAPVQRLPTSTYLTVTLVSDERAVDGEAAALFLTTFKSLMETPNAMQ